MACYSKLTIRHESPKQYRFRRNGKAFNPGENVQDKMAAVEKVETSIWCYCPGDLVSIEEQHISLSIFSGLK